MPTKIRKRYWIPVALLLIAWAGLHLLTAFLNRKSNEEIRTAMQQAGVTASFPTLTSGNYKLVSIQADEAEPQRPLVLLLHGSPGSSDNYLDYLMDSALSRRMFLVSPDRPGFGLSLPARGVEDLEEQARLLRAVLADYGDRPAILVGHSMGGPLIARMAIDYPELVSGLVFIAASVDPELEPSTWYRKIIRVPPVSWLLPKAIRVSNEELLPLREELEKMLPLWSQIQCPVTVIHGTEDSMVPPGNADFIREQAVNSTHLVVDTISGGDHFILWSEHERIKAALYNMLEHIR